MSMQIEPKDTDEYFSSKETMKRLKITSCELMHLRVANKIKFVKRGNAYFYQADSLTKTNNIG